MMMLELLVGFLALTNIVTLVLFVRSVDRGDSGEYNIVGFWNGEVLEGPLSLKKARRAQRRWDRLFMWHGGPRTSVELARKK